MLLAQVHLFDIFVALPLSVLAAFVVSLLTQPPDAAHLAKCFEKVKS